MINNLRSKKCQACNSKTPALTLDERAQLLKTLEKWEITECDNIPRIVRRFTFKNFASALAFTNQVGALAEQEQHHPLIELTWGYAKISYWTHAIGDISLNDFIMAAKTDMIAKLSAPS